MSQFLQCTKRVYIYIHVLVLLHWFPSTLSASLVPHYRTVSFADTQTHNIDLSSSWPVAAPLCAVIFAVYAYTAYPSVAGGDSGMLFLIDSSVSSSCSSSLLTEINTVFFLFVVWLFFLFSISCDISQLANFRIAGSVVWPEIWFLIGGFWSRCIERVPCDNKICPIWDEIWI